MSVHVAVVGVLAGLPIREALKSLVVRGVIGRKGRGTVVADALNAAPVAINFPALAVEVNIKQLYEVRKLIEVQIAGWAATRAAAKDIKALRRAVENESPTPASASPHRAFHDALAAAVHNPALAQIYKSGSELFFRLPFYWKLFDDNAVKTVRARRHEMARRWHEHILTAVEQHDVAEAKGAMFQHLDIMEKDLLGRLQIRDGKPNLYCHPMLAELGTGKKDFLERKRVTR